MPGQENIQGGDKKKKSDAEFIFKICFLHMINSVFIRENS